MMRHFLNNNKIKFYSSDNKKDLDFQLNSNSQIELNSILNKIVKNNFKKYKISFNSNLDFHKNLNIIRASGGLVVNEKNEILLIYRKGYWDLPKGKIEHNETTEKAAIREVEEETGVRNLKIQKYIATTFHWYMYKGKWALKESIWYEMHTFKQLPIPQIEEDIEKIIWVQRDELPKYFKGMHASIKYLFKKYFL